MKTVVKLTQAEITEAICDLIDRRISAGYHHEMIIDANPQYNMKDGVVSCEVNVTIKNESEEE